MKLAGSGGGITGLKKLRDEKKMIISDHNDISTCSPEFLVEVMVGGRGSEGRCFIRHLAKPPRLICITTIAATENKAALNFYGPAENAAASGGRATTWAREY